MQSNNDLIAPLISMMLNLVCAGFLYQVSIGKKSAIYLRYLSVAWALFSASRAARIGGDFWLVAFPEADGQNTRTVAEFIDTLFSFCSSFLLFLGAYLLNKWPDERIASLKEITGLSFIGGASVVVALANASARSLSSVEALDMISSTFAMGAIAGVLCKVGFRSGTNLPAKIAAFAAFCAATIDTILQPWFVVAAARHWGWYNPTLTTASVVTAFLIAIFSVLMFRAAPISGNQTVQHYDV